MLGAMYIEGVNHGIVVTTSSFTKPARDVQHDVNQRIGPHNLDLHDFADIQAWLRLAHDQYFNIGALDELVTRIAYGGSEKFRRKFVAVDGKPLRLA